MDVKILSTYGFDEKDVAAVRESGQAHGFYAGYSADLFLKTAGQPDVIAKVYSLPRQREGKDFLNQPVLLEGRMPEAPGECLVENNMPMDYAFSLGQTVTLASGDPEEPVSDRLDRDTYTVVGIVRSPLYLNFDRGFRQHWQRRGGLFCPPFQRRISTWRSTPTCTSPWKGPRAFPPSPRNIKTW